MSRNGSKPSDGHVIRQYNEYPEHSSSLSGQQTSLSIFQPPSSPRFALQTLANILPLPWSRSSSANVEPGSPVHDPRATRLPLKRAFVPKEVQLEKLRYRLAKESSSARDTCYHCKNCDEALILL